MPVLQQYNLSQALFLTRRDCLRPVTKRTLASLVAEQIRSDIVMGNLKAAQKLPSELDLCQALNVGRPTLREALRILEGQGWIQFRLANGAYVSDPERVGERMAAHFEKGGLLDLMELEIRQLEQEGREISAELRGQHEVLKAEGSLREIEAFYQQLQQLPTAAGFAFDEPDALAFNRSLDPSGSAEHVQGDPGALFERIHGGLLGRCVGGAVGEPLQGWAEDAIEKYLRVTGSWPLAGFVTVDPEQASAVGYSFSPGEAGTPLQAGGGSFSGLNFTVLNIKALQKHGIDFTTEDIADAWLSALPYKQTLTAERQAYANLVRGVSPPATASTYNPFREWLGAMVRSDLYGLISAGDPHAAATLACRDARLSHTKNGAYGAMFIAAAIAAAFAATNAKDIVMRAVAEIPPASRLARLVEQVVAWWGSGLDWQETLRRVNADCTGYRRPHVLPNAARVVIGLLYGGFDFTKSICTAAMCGGDSDCNAGAVGSILGVRVGGASIPVDLSAGISTTIRAAVAGYQESSIESVSRTIAGLVQQRSPARHDTRIGTRPRST
jgi:ADP-ribosylglycohydrolase/DNA-binding transcriptional regulator YhcF (GntR family)